MNEVVDGYLVELLGMLKQGASFIVGELPLFAHEILVWGIVSNIVSIVVGFITVAVLALIMNESHKIVKTHDERDYAEYPAWFVWAFSFSGTIIAGTVAFIVAICNSFEIFKAIYAPRIYLIEQITNMIANK